MAASVPTGLSPNIARDTYTDDIATWMSSRTGHEHRTTIIRPSRRSPLFATGGWIDGRAQQNGPGGRTDRSRSTRPAASSKCKLPERLIDRSESALSLSLPNNVQYIVGLIIIGSLCCVIDDLDATGGADMFERSSSTS